jgi:hypothetical protein
VTNNPHTARAVRNAPVRKPQNQSSLSVKPGTVHSGNKSNRTPMQRVLHGTFATSFSHPVSRQLLTQRSPFTQPLNVRTRLQTVLPPNTMAPHSLAPARIVGTQTARAASGQGTAPAPAYGQAPPAYLGIRNNALQSLGVPTIRRPIRRPPQGGLITPGAARNLARGQGRTVRPFVHN